MGLSLKDQQQPLVLRTFESWTGGDAEAEQRERRKGPKVLGQDKGQADSSASIRHKSRLLKGKSGEQEKEGKEKTKRILMKKEKKTRDHKCERS